jgi:uncharacterized repeat protein (TIGR04076 family)
MSEWYQVKAKIISQKGTCSAGHKVGDEFIIGDVVPKSICSWAFYTLFPFVSALQSGGSFPWEKDADKATVACPDAENPVVFQLTRVKNSQDSNINNQIKVTVINKKQVQ